MSKSKQIVGNFDDQEKSFLYYRVINGLKDVDVPDEDSYYYYLTQLLPCDMTGLNILDVGGGNGHWSEEFHSRGARRILLIDKSPAMIELAEQRKNMKSLERLEIRNVNIEDYLATSEEKFDIIFSSYSLMYFPHVTKILQGLCDRLSHMGQLIIVTNNFEVGSGCAPLDVPIGMIIPLAFGADEKIHFETLYQPAALYLQGIEMAGLRAVDFCYFSDNANAIEQNFDNKYDLRIRSLVVHARK